MALNTKSQITETSLIRRSRKSTSSLPAGDDGGALGAALWAYHLVLNHRATGSCPHAYWGQEYSEAEVRQFLDEKGAKYTRITTAR